MSRTIRNRLAVCVVFAVAGHVHACGPFFPDSILTSDEAVLAPPLGSFGAELARTTADLLPQCTAQVTTNDYPQEVIDADTADLTKVVSDRQVIDNYRKARVTMRDHLAKVDDGEAVQRWRTDPALARPAWPVIEIPEGLPGEFADYLAGAIAYHQGRLEDARAAWLRLLHRPATQRRWRSVWAAYMLGRSWVSADPAQAIKWFTTTRRLAADRFADSLGLAAASLGWQARAELNRNHPVAAIDLYLAQYRAGDPSAVVSLRLAASKLIEDPQELRKAARQRNTRRVLTAYLVARAGRQPEAVPQETLTAWLRAVEAANVTDMEGADRLAWLAYHAGQWDRARRWLDRAPGQSPIGGWVDAKLLLRDGRVDAATRRLAALVRSFPADADWQGAYTRFDPESCDWPPTHAAPAQVRGELGVLQLARGQYVDALDSLMTAGYWLDAAYVAERVLTVDELVAYVNRRTSAPTVAADPEAAPGGATALRLLLARRLARLNRYDDARPYFDPALQAKLDAYAAALNAGRDATRPVAERAAGLWDAARVARGWGLGLLSTEVEPDWHFARADFELDPFGKERPPSDRRRVVGSRADEQQRAAASAVDPCQRFHYRYRAAALAWEAALLMPDQSDDTARVLCEAGTWLKRRDPQAANRFYKALVTRCGHTTLGQQADRRRWFPDLDDGPPR